MSSRFLHQSRNAGSFGDGNEFQRRLRIVRFFADRRSVEVADTTLHRSDGTRHEKVQLRDLDELAAAVRDELALERFPIADGVRALEARRGRPLFSPDGGTS